MRTLAIDIGGTGLKASVLDEDGTMIVDRVRVATTYPMSPSRMVDLLTGLIEPLPDFDRVSVGFPGMVRGGKVLTAPHFVTAVGPGSEVVPELLEAWTGFDLAGALAARLGKPVKVVNDADLQGVAVIRGQGLEFVITLGTGVGTALFRNGRLCPHMEFAHHPFRRDQTYNQELGDAARALIGKKKWNRRVRLAITTFDNLLIYDHLYLGGGNARRITFELPANASIVDNAAGILGGIKLWQQEEL